MAQSTSLYRQHSASGVKMQSTLYDPASPIGGANRAGISSYVISPPRAVASPIVDFGLPLSRMTDGVLAQSAAAIARLRAHQEMQSLLVTNTVSPSPLAPPHHQHIGANRLEMLRAAMGIPDLDHDAIGGRQAFAPIAASPSGKPVTQLSVDATRILSRDTRGLLFVDSILEADVLCGRGGLSNHHPGNKRFRRVVSEMKRTYRCTETKNNKTSLSRAIVDHVCNYGGRFIKKDDKTGRYHVLTKADARKKTSQALRETKELKWTV